MANTTNFKRSMSRYIIAIFKILSLKSVPYNGTRMNKVGLLFKTGCWQTIKQSIKILRESSFQPKTPCPTH